MHEEFLDAVIKGVRATDNKWIAAWRDHDVKTVAHLYVDNAFIITPSGERVSGRDSVTAYLRATLPRSGSLETSLLDVDASDRIAMTLDGYVMSPSASGQPPERGWLLTIFKSDGRTWRIRSQVFRPAPVAGGS